MYPSLPILYVIAFLATVKWAAFSTTHSHYDVLLVTDLEQVGNWESKLYFLSWLSWVLVTTTETRLIYYSAQEYSLWGRDGLKQFESWKVPSVSKLQESDSIGNKQSMVTSAASYNCSFFAGYIISRMSSVWNKLKLHIIVLVWYSGHFLLTASFFLAWLEIWRCFNVQDLGYFSWHMLMPATFFQFLAQTCTKKENIK